MDIAKRFPENPILRPSDLRPGIDGMEIVCLLNPGVFRLGGPYGTAAQGGRKAAAGGGAHQFPHIQRPGRDRGVVFRQG